MLEEWNPNAFQNRGTRSIGRPKLRCEGSVCRIEERIGSKGPDFDLDADVN
jgi:hypothetical protein